MCVDLVSIPTAVQGGKLCQGATSVSCVSSAPDVVYNKLSLHELVSGTEAHTVCHSGRRTSDMPIIEAWGLIGAKSNA